MQYNVKASIKQAPYQLLEVQQWCILVSAYKYILMQMLPPNPLKMLNEQNTNKNPNPTPSYILNKNNCTAM